MTMDKNYVFAIVFFKPNGTMDIKGLYNTPEEANYALEFEFGEPRMFSIRRIPLGGKIEITGASNIITD